AGPVVERDFLTVNIFCFSIPLYTLRFIALMLDYNCFSPGHFISMLIFNGLRQRHCDCKSPEKNLAFDIILGKRVSFILQIWPNHSILLILQNLPRVVVSRKIRYTTASSQLSVHKEGSHIKMISPVVILMLVGVALGAAPSYHQERPSREQLAQWEAELGIADFNLKGGPEDPELEDIVDPTLLNELGPLRSIRHSEPFTDCKNGPCVSNHPLFQK
ncbi:hypothetical protein L9F63_009994, partial [Diploptera punctata]